eukprot:scaffold1381_cov81-Skeletonema_dohrnii-CCMP3373.AAC.2
MAMIMIRTMEMDGRRIDLAYAYSYSKLSRYDRMEGLIWIFHEIEVMDYGALKNSAFCPTTHNQGFVPVSVPARKYPKNRIPVPTYPTCVFIN